MLIFFSFQFKIKKKIYTVIYIYHKKYQSVQHSIQLKILFNNISVFNRFQIPLFKALFNHFQSFIPDQNTNSICIIRETRKTARIQFTQCSLKSFFLEKLMFAFFYIQQHPTNFPRMHGKISLMYPKNSHAVLNYSSSCRLIYINSL